MSGMLGICLFRSSQALQNCWERHRSPAALQGDEFVHPYCNMISHCQKKPPHSPKIWETFFFLQLGPREDPFPRGLFCYKNQRQGSQGTCPSLLQSPEGWEVSKSHSKELTWQWTSQMVQRVLLQQLVAGRPTEVKGRGRQSAGWRWLFLWGGREQRLFKIFFPAPLADFWGSPHCLASGLLKLTWFFHLFQGLLCSNWGSNAECSWAQEEGTSEALLSPESNIYPCWQQVSFKNWKSFESGDNKELFGFINLSTFSVKGNFTLFFVRMRGRLFLCQDLFLQHGSPPSKSYKQECRQKHQPSLAVPCHWPGSEMSSLLRLCL